MKARFTKVIAVVVMAGAITTMSATAASARFKWTSTPHAVTHQVGRR